MIERNVDLTSRDVTRSAPDCLTLSNVQKTRENARRPALCMLRPSSVPAAVPGAEGTFCDAEPAVAVRQAAAM